MGTKEILQKLGIQDLNAMQQDMMQAFRKHDNLVLLSPTGSGKTLAYLLPLFEMLRADASGVQAMVIVPSRELALQTLKVVKDSGTPLRACAVYGGRPAMEESRSMKGIRPQLVIGTPGRLLDHLQKGNIDASGIRTIVLDEFDKCLEMGFREEMAHVFSYLTGVSKRVLLSATDDREITSFLPSSVRLDYLDESARTENVELFFVKSPEKDKLETLRALLLAKGQESSLVFVGYRESVERIAKYLRSEGFIISAMHGAMEQKNRERELYRFLEGSTNVFVCTDLASRGLDIPALDNVIHYHLPLDERTYVHRNGRTGRWDKSGRSFLILGPEETLPPYIAEADISRFLPETELSDARIPEPPVWESLYIGKGKKDKLSKGDIAGFLMKTGGLTKEEVGRIDVRDHYSYVAVARRRAGEVLSRLRGQKIKGIKTIIERTR